MINKKLNNKGFTLIETLIAIVVLMTAIVGPLSLAAQGLRTTLIAKDQDTAFYLAQDAVEFVRFVRDTNSLRGNTWLAGLDGTTSDNNFLTVDGVGGDCTGSSGCYVDTFASSITSCGIIPGATCPVLKYDTSLGRFSYSSGTPTIFTRKIAIATPVGSNDGEASVTVTVSWSDQAGLTRSIVVREDMFNWQLEPGAGGSSDPGL